jgi:hypothetical protein
MPMQNKIEYVAIVLSTVGFNLVLHDFSSWGNNDMVVNVAATKPTMVTMFIVFALLLIAVSFYFRLSL